MNVFYSSFEVLGVEPGTSSAEIKRRYKALIRQHSPEKEPEKFSAIREAFENLNNGELGCLEKLPIYRRPMEWLNQMENKEKKLDIPEREPLSGVFETPYNTWVELRNLIRKERHRW
ncbi:MAG TPA: hypothetical protein ENJ20_00285 [Bacteroidetes bacterium]|nr:hypothetical protein [Bacteroidota bacterium]